MSQPTTSPVLFLVFNRPETTRKVFEAIRAARPRRLYVAADGPRPHRPDDATKCQQVRELIAQGLDWDCQLFTLYREQNLGCRDAVSEGITWFFEHEEMGIILEDDCLPHPDCFGFCQDVLEHFKEDDRVGMISGFNFAPNSKHFQSDYLASRLGMIWGWATWRRVWKLFEVSISSDKFEKGMAIIDQHLPESFYFRYFKKSIRETYKNKIDTWDYFWYFALLSNRMVCLTPRHNLIENIGLGEDATHTKSIRTLPGRSTASYTFPLLHSSEIRIERAFDRLLILLLEDRKDNFWARLRFYARAIKQKASNNFSI